MRIVLFCHSLLSDWNHGNAHFLRGVATELVARGHELQVYEAADAWSVTNLLADAPHALDGFRTAYPSLSSRRLERWEPHLDRVLDRADVVIVHEWSDPQLVRAIGRHRAVNGQYILLFHDTHHRSVSDESAMAAYDLEHYDGVLAFGEAIRTRYLARGWARAAWTWHEAADTRMFYPRAEADKSGDLVWVGNWGDDERAAELEEYLCAPAAGLRLRAAVYGVRYPASALAALASAGIEYRGWTANYRVPRLFSRFRVTVHIPRRPYVQTLPGIPTIRVFEALACGIPLLSSWWDDCEGLFTPGEDFLIVRSGEEMTRALRDLLNDPARASAMAQHGLRTIESRHTCAHRVDELLRIVGSLQGAPTAEKAAQA